MNPSDYEHIVGNVQHALDRIGLKAPRGLCGFDLRVSDGFPDPDPGTLPLCPTCADRAGWDSDRRQEATS